MRVFHICHKRKMIHAGYTLYIMHTIKCKERNKSILSIEIYLTFHLIAMPIHPNYPYTFYTLLFSNNKHLSQSSSILKVTRHGQSRSNLTPRTVQQCHRRENRPRGQFWILIRHSHVLSIEGKGQDPRIHVEADPQKTLLLEFLTIGRTRSIRVVSQLAQT
jgi:hypothetical protein